MRWVVTARDAVQGRRWTKLRLCVALEVMSQVDLVGIVE